MAKRTGGSRAKRHRSGQVARPVRKRRASEPGRYEAIAGEAADSIAANSTKGRSRSVEDLVQEHIAAPNQEPGRAERDRHAEDVVVSAAFVIGMLRHFIVNCDEDEKPFVRVIGRVVYMLTVDGKHKSCTATPIAVALLLFLPEHLDAEHRQDGTTRDAIDVTETRLQALIYDRLNKLTGPTWSMAGKEPSGRGYRLTEAGCFVFNSWPEDVVFDPQNADLWKRKQPGIRAGVSARGPATRR
jgi:hypothetical protein